MTAVFEGASRPTFRERAAALCGPGQPWRTANDVAHAIGAVGGINADVAIALATGVSPEPATLRVLRWLGRTLAGERKGALGRVRPYAGQVALYAWNACTKGWQVPPAPAGVDPSDWGEAVLFACLLLETAADEALHAAARKWRGAA